MKKGKSILVLFAAIFCALFIKLNAKSILTASTDWNGVDGILARENGALQPGNPVNDSNQKAADKFAETIKQQFADLGRDFIERTGPEKQNVKEMKPGRAYFECQASFENALDCTIERDSSGLPGKQTTIFYNGPDPKQADEKFDLLLEQMKKALTPDGYKFANVVDDGALKSILAGKTNEEGIMNMETANLRIEKDHENYVVLIEIGY